MTAQPDLFLGAAADTRGEFAPTPSWVIRPALEALVWTDRDIRTGMVRPRICRVLDAGAGIGALGMAVEAYATAEASYRPHVVAVEREADRVDLLPDHWYQSCADFPEWTAAHLRDAQQPFDLVVCNPPFSRWLEWAQLCLRLIAPGGALVMVGPLAYLGGVERGGWLATHRPARVHVHCRRPRGQGWDDTREIATVTWEEGWKLPTALLWVP